MLKRHRHNFWIMIEKGEVYKSLKVSRAFQNGMESETTKI